MCKAKKSAYNQALQNAFQKVILVVLASGKVHVEVDTTVRELLQHDKHLNTQAVITVCLL